MNIRQRKHLHWPTRLLTLVACLFLSDTASLAQSDSKDVMQVEPPAVPRYRRPHPVFEVSADPASKPLPAPTVIAVPPPTVPPPVAEAKPQTPAPVQPVISEAKARERLRQETERDQQSERWAALGRAAAFLAAIGVGIFCTADIVRQIRKAKQRAAAQDEEEENESEP